MVGDEEERQLEELEGGLVLDELLDPLDHLLELAADLGLEDLGEVVHVVELEGLGPGEVVVKVLEVKGILISREVCLLLNGQQIVKDIAQNVRLPLPLPLCRVLLLDSSSPVSKPMLVKL